MASILDSLHSEFKRPEGTTYKQALNAAVGEIISDLRDRNREQREMLSMAKAQIELAQGENRRLYDRLERAEVRLQALSAPDRRNGGLLEHQSEPAGAPQKGE